MLDMLKFEVVVKLVLIGIISLRLPDPVKVPPIAVVKGNRLTRRFPPPLVTERFDKVKEPPGTFVYENTKSSLSVAADALPAEKIEIARTARTLFRARMTSLPTELNDAETNH